MEDDFWIQHRVSKKNFNINFHFEHRYQIVFVIKGEIRYTVGEKVYNVSRGGMILLNTLESHDLEVVKYPYERYVIQINPLFFQKELKYPEIISIFISRPPDFSHMIVLNTDVWNYVYQCIVEMFDEYQKRDKCWKIMIGSNLRRMFVNIFRRCSSKAFVDKINASTALAFKIQNYLDQNYTKNLTLDRIADEFFLDKYYLSHVFKDVTGYSIIEYAIFLRINKAKILLSQTNQSISSIALQCGYTNMTHFARQFKKSENCTPSDFRKRYTERIKII